MGQGTSSPTRARAMRQKIMSATAFKSGSERTIASRRLATSIYLCFLVALIPACTKSTAKFASVEKSRDASAINSTTIETKKILAGDIPAGKWNDTVLPSRESLRAVHFTSKDNGWVASAGGSLYRTQDGGDSWKRVELRNRPGNYLVSLNFSGDKLGWAVFSKYPLDYSDSKAYGALILQTEDGGDNWSPQYERQQASINRVRFNQHEGWAIGVTYDGSRTSHLALHTTDQGKHWEDVSKEFERAVNSPANHDFPIDVYSSKPSQATVLTVGGRVMRTDDSGHKWRKIETIEDEFQQTGFMQIGGFANDSVWALGGADSKEGIWVLFSVLNRDNSWTKYRTTQVFFRDAVFLREGGTIACGSVPDYENPRKVTERRAALISYSSDEGRSWSVMYRSSKSRIMNALFAFDANHIWAVGDKGLIVRLQ